MLGRSEWLSVLAKAPQELFEDLWCSSDLDPSYDIENKHLMVKNYSSNTSFGPKTDQPRKIVVDRILAFSKAYSRAQEKSSALDLLKN